MTSRTLTAIFMCCAFIANAQLPLLNWVKPFKAANAYGNMANSNNRTVGVDPQGNVYTAGLFEQAVDFDPGPGVYSLIPTGPNTNIFISKLDASGKFIWAKQIATYVEFGRINLKVDGAGNVYLASDLRLEADMDPGTGVFMMKPTGFRDAFVVKLDTDGNFKWAKQFGGPGDTGPQADMLALDQNNDIIIAGLFNNTVDFDPGPGLFNITASAHMQAFIAKLTNNGEFVWAKQFGNGPSPYSGCHISDIDLDGQGNIICTGIVSRTVDFDPGPNVYNYTSSPGAVEDGFICKLDAACNFIWVKTLGQNGGNNSILVPTGLAVDALGNVITTGLYIGAYDFDPGPGTQIVNSNPHDCYILKLDQNGNLVWAKTIGGKESDTGHDVAVDSDNNIYTIGGFGTSVDFDPGAGVYTVNSPYYGASALVKLAANGDFIYAAPFQSLNYGTSYFYRMAVDAGQNIFIAGSVSGENDFDPGPNVFSVTGTSNSSPFVLKLSRCLNNTRSVLNVTACNSYMLNNRKYVASGTYQQTIPNSLGCDSIITLNLTLSKKQNEQKKAICRGDVFFAEGKNQINPGTYTDTFKTVYGCDSIVITHLTVDPRPLPKLQADKKLCSNSQVILTPGAFRSYLWQDGSRGDSFVVKSPGNYWVDVSNEFNCTSTDTFTVQTMFPAPANFLKAQDSLCAYERLEVMPASVYAQYQWSTGATEKKILLTKPGVYSLTVVDRNGCTGADSITIVAKNCLEGFYIPTAFSPNGDAHNENFRPLLFGRIKKLRFTIYNRWGEVVFQTTEAGKGWNGMLKGQPLRADVFVWTCTYQLEGGKEEMRKGNVSLLR